MGLSALDYKKDIFCHSTINKSGICAVSPCLHRPSQLLHPSLPGLEIDPLRGTECVLAAVGWWHSLIELSSATRGTGWQEDSITYTNNAKARSQRSGIVRAFFKVQGIEAQTLTQLQGAGQPCIGLNYPEKYFLPRPPTSLGDPRVLTRQNPPLALQSRGWVDL
jgi:hypothetical protein